MHAGVSYLINLANETKGACVSGALFAPGTTSFGAEEGGGEEGKGTAGSGRCCTSTAAATGCSRPDRARAGATASRSRHGCRAAASNASTCRSRAAGPAETAPGLTLGNYAHAHGYLDGRSVRVLRLYRMEVTSHSNLTLKLTAPESAEFKLQLRNQNGDVIECDCEGSGSQTLQHQLRPGTYYAVVSVRSDSAGNFTLVRESRTITATSISFTSAKAAPGEGLGIDVKVSPAESGPVTVEIERFDPVFGWQFYREVPAFASGGLAGVPFTPPTAGMWRAKATYEGSAPPAPAPSATPTCSSPSPAGALRGAHKCRYTL